MIIQTYVENSIKHGLMHITHKGLLKVEIKSDNNNLIIVVSDNGIGREMAAKLSTRGAGLGMSIMEQFFELYNSVNQNKITIEVIDMNNSTGDACGTKIKIKFPKDFKYSIR